MRKKNLLCEMEGKREKGRDLVVILKVASRSKLLIVIFGYQFSPIFIFIEMFAAQHIHMSLKEGFFGLRKTSGGGTVSPLYRFWYFCLNNN